MLSEISQRKTNTICSHLHDFHSHMEPKKKRKKTHSTDNRLVVARGMWEGEGRIRRVGLVVANYCISSVQSLSRVQFFATP